MNKTSFWYRKGDLYTSLKRKSNGNKIRKVAFTNATPASVTMRKMEIYCNEGKQTIARFKISPFKWEKFKKICDPFFSWDVLIYNNARKSISIQWSENFIVRIISLMNYLCLEGETFPEVFLSELININAFILGNSEHRQAHFIASGIPDISKEHSIFSLLNAYETHHSHAQLEMDLKKALVAGVNPNQKNAQGQTPLSILFLHMPATLENRDTLFLLLFNYGANLWVSVNELTGYSLIELLEYQQSDQYFAHLKSLLQSPIDLKKVPKIVKGIDVFSTNKNTIFTTISFNNGSVVWSELKAMQDLEYEEKKSLFLLYSQAFHSVNGNILASFEHAFSPAPGKWVDILRDPKDGKIIGANVFIIKIDEKSVLVYIDLSFLHPDYRGMGIMPLIDFRIPFALQCIFKERCIKIFFLSASYFAIKKVEPIKFFPKYQTKNMLEEVKADYLKIYEPLQWMTHDGIYCTVKEEEQVSVTPPSKKMLTPMEKFYYTQLCGSGDGYVPVMVYADDMRAMLQELLAVRQVNFLAHCQEMAVMFSETRILTDLHLVSKHSFLHQKNIPMPEMRHAMHPRY